MSTSDIPGSIVRRIAAHGAQLEQCLDAAREEYQEPASGERARKFLARALRDFPKDLDRECKLVRIRYGKDCVQKLRGTYIFDSLNQLVRSARRLSARMGLDPHTACAKPTLEEAFLDSETLFITGSREDVELLRQAAKRWNYSFLGEHACQLERRLVQDGDPLDAHAPLRCHGNASTEHDLLFAEEWYRYNRDDIRRRYPGKVVVVSCEGVVAVGDTVEEVEEEVYRLQNEKGRFWAYLGRPSESEEERKHPSSDSKEQDG